MSQWLPRRLRQPFERLREDIHQALERWRARRTGNRRENGAYGRSADGHMEGFTGSLWQQGAIDKGWPDPLASGDGVRVDIEETDDEVVVLAELPGLKKGDFKVDLTEDRLVLRGEKRHDSEEQRQGYYYAERSYGAFARAIPLPSEVDPRKAKAKYKNGLLRITLPKAAHAKTKRITVHAQ